MGLNIVENIGDHFFLLPYIGIIPKQPVSVGLRDKWWYKDNNNEDKIICFSILSLKGWRAANQF